MVLSILLLTVRVVGERIRGHPHVGNDMKYICVSSETDSTIGRRRIFVQILFRGKVNIVPFLEDLTDGKSNLS